jgi:hypothetical protein
LFTTTPFVYQLRRQIGRIVYVMIDARIRCRCEAFCVEAVLPKTARLALSLRVDSVMA